MRKIFIVLIGALFLFSCNNDNPDTRKVNNAKTFQVDWTNDQGGQISQNFTIVVIDSCEYITGRYDRSRFLTHKGNCKNPIHQR